jgi:protein-disulfide isomerase
MIRRTLVILSVLFLCLDCVAQSEWLAFAKKIEIQVRSFYKLSPDIHVLVGTPTTTKDFPNYESVIVTLDGGQAKQDLTFLVAKDRSSLKQIVDFDLSKNPFAEIMGKIDLTGRPRRGARESKVTVVSFDDFECPFCARMHRTLFPELLKQYGDRVTFVYKDFPLLQIHPWALHAAINANCLGAQNTDAYWDFADYVHADQQEVNNEKTAEARLAKLDQLTVQQGEKHGLDIGKLQVCLKAQDETAVRASLKQGEAIGVEATPTLFINGEELTGGATSDKIVREAIDRALEDAGVLAPEHAHSAQVSVSK